MTLARSAATPPLPHPARHRPPPRPKGFGQVSAAMLRRLGSSVRMAPAAHHSRLAAPVLTGGELLGSPAEADFGGPAGPLMRSYLPGRARARTTTA